MAGSPSSLFIVVTIGAGIWRANFHTEVWTWNSKAVVTAAIAIVAGACVSPATTIEPEMSDQGSAGDATPDMVATR